MASFDDILGDELDVQLDDFARQAKTSKAAILRRAFERFIAEDALSEWQALRDAKLERDAARQLVIAYVRAVRAYQAGDISITAALKSLDKELSEKAVEWARLTT